MNAKGWAITAGLGAAAGAVAVLMMPRNNPTRRLMAKAANKVEDVAWKMGDTISQKIDSMDMDAEKDKINEILDNYNKFDFCGLVIKYNNEVVSFAILLMNLFVPLIDKFILPKPFGFKKPAKIKEAK